MKLFITGGTGFIGQHTLQELKRRKHRLLVLSRQTRNEPGVNFIKKDFSDIRGWEGQLKRFRPDAAVHLAWEGIPDFSYVQSVKNLSGGLALFSALALVGCKKIVAVGSGFEYGNRIGKVCETMNIIPNNPFVAAKHSLHLMGEQLAKENNMDFIWFRAFNVYGHGQRSGSLIPYIINCIATGSPLRLKNPLTQGDFVYVGDMARAIADAIDRGHSLKTYNVSSGQLTPVKEIAKMVCGEMGVNKEYYDDFLKTVRGRITGGCYAEIKNIRKEIGWRPTTDIKKGIQKTILDFKKYNENYSHWFRKLRS